MTGRDLTHSPWRAIGTLRLTAARDELGTHARTHAHRTALLYFSLVPVSVLTKKQAADDPGGGQRWAFVVDQCVRLYSNVEWYLIGLHAYARACACAHSCMCARACESEGECIVACACVTSCRDAKAFG